MPVQGRSRMAEDGTDLERPRTQRVQSLASAKQRIHDSVSNDTDSLTLTTNLPCDYPPPGSQSGTPVHSELSRSNSLSLQDSWKLQRVEAEMKKCLGKNTTEILLKSYSCALQRDILVHGRMYVTPNWFCFYSNILGWETKVNIKLTDVTSISKQKTALVFPNAILIEVGHKKFGFSSVVYRDKVYHVLVTVWKNALSSNPLSDVALMAEINDWKHHSKDLPDSILSTSFTIDSSDQDTDPEHHPPRHTLATSTEHTMNSSDTDSHASIEHVDSGYLPPRHSSCSDVSTNSLNSETNTSSQSSTSDPHIHDVPMSSSKVLQERSTESIQHARSCEARDQRSWFAHKLSSVDQKLVWLKRSPLLRHCSSTVIVNMLLIIFILILLVSTLTMLCRLSHMEPSLQPYLVLQPWCRLCSGSSDIPTLAHSPASAHTSQHLSDTL